MENKPTITIVGRTIPPSILEKYDKWSEGAYMPIYVKLPGLRAIDSYNILRQAFDLPGRLAIYHGDSLESRQRRAINPNAIATARDRQITFGSIETFFVNCYELTRTFQKDRPVTETVNETTVADAPVIHIEGYAFPPAENEKFEVWLNKWAARVYIPLLLEIPGVKACNFFKLLDYQDPRYENTRFIETEMPRYLSITYLKDDAAAAEFNLSPKFAAFRHDLELEFTVNLKTMWNTEYGLFSSHRP
jgi:hypothetical protein